MSRFLIAAALALPVAAGSASALAQGADPCLTNKCRGADAAVIFTDVDGQKKSAAAANLPYTNVEKHAITVMLGETLTFTAESDGKALTKVALLSAAKAGATDPAALPATVQKGQGQIVLKFAQTQDPATHSRLVVTHNFAGKLAFDAYILPFPAGEYKESPTCPVAQGGRAATTWSVPVLVATLANLRLDDKAAAPTASEVKCE